MGPWFLTWHLCLYICEKCEMSRLWRTDTRTDEQWKVEQYSVWAESAISCNFHKIFPLVATNFRVIGVNYHIFQVMHEQHLACASLAIYADWATWRATLLRKNQTAWRYKCLVNVIVIFVNVITVIIVIIRHKKKGEIAVQRMSWSLCELLLV